MGLSPADRRPRQRNERRGNRLNRPFALKMFADWTDRIAKGETPAVKPPRPTGIERNVVITQWDWGTDHSFMHDQVSTSKQNPTIEWWRQRSMRSPLATELWWCSIRRQTRRMKSKSRPVRIDPQIGSRFPPPNPPSLWWGDARLWNGPTYDPSDPHNPMMDEQGPRLADFQDP